MPTTDHPLVLDLGSVIGPTGPQGPSGVATTSGTPSPSVGSNGDVMIDPATGIFYKKTDGTWSSICTVVLKPLDTEIDEESTNPVTNAAIAAAFGEVSAALGELSTALDGKIPVAGTSTGLEMAGSGTFSGTHDTLSHGPIALLRLASTNKDPTVWARTINIGAKETATAIATLPDGVRSVRTMRFYGVLHTEAKSYKAGFEMFSGTAGDYAGKVIVDGVYDEDWQRVTSNGNVVTQFVATGFDVSCVYFIS